MWSSPLKIWTKSPVACACTQAMDGSKLLYSHGNSRNIKFLKLFFTHIEKQNHLLQYKKTEVASISNKAKSCRVCFKNLNKPVINRPFGVILKFYKNIES